MSKIQIIVQALASAYVIAHLFIPSLKRLLIRCLESGADRKKAKVPKDDLWGDTVGYINSELNMLKKEIVNWKLKPFSCIKCMTFWVAVISAIITGMHNGDIVFVGVVGLAAGMILDGLLMRYF